MVPLAAGPISPDWLLDRATERVTLEWHRTAERVEQVTALLYDTLVVDFPDQAAYAVALGYRIRYAMQMNAREAMHLCELRSSPQGHPSYRLIAQEMHRLIAEQAGHTAIAAAMRYVDNDDHELGRLAAERAAEARRVARG